MNTITDEAFAITCIKDTLNGLRAGISLISGPSSVAVIYCLTPERPLCIYDPSNLLGGYALIIQTVYLDGEMIGFIRHLASPLTRGTTG